jgi:hypothetical protein
MIDQQKNFIVQDLKMICRLSGQAQSGNKTDLVPRVTAYFNRVFNTSGPRRD